MWFTLTVDDVGIKYIGKQNALHLTTVLKSDYNMETDWTGGLYHLYCGITLEWNEEQRYVDIFMPSYVKQKLIEYEHISLKRAHYCPYQPNPIKYGKNSDQITHIVESPLPTASNKKFVQQVLGSFLYYTHVIGPTILHALSVTVLDNGNSTERTMQRVHQLFDYMHANPNAMLHFYASEMILDVHSDASYMSAGCTSSRTGG